MFGIETSLARAAAATYEDVEIPAMLAPVKPYAGILREDDVLVLVLIGVLLG